jgi:eukaryotic-like serine/threonine-protein kinase
MDSVRERKALDIFTRLLDVADADLPREITSACQGDVTLQGIVEKLLQADGVRSSLMPTEMNAVAVVAAQAVPPPDRIGPYRLAHLLGRGGMGEVYAGERDDGLFEQQVAIKLIRPLLIGGDAAMRFADERRILAKLHHPNIAQLLDGGVDPEGRNYIIMEFVPGLPIDEFVRATHYPLPQILHLFQLVCQAVHYAHQNLIVHADLKPSNIVVTDDGQPKLLDFGIARLITADSPASDPPPGSPQPLTRAYASPERKAGALPSIFDDVFALGRVLADIVPAGPVPADIAAIIARATAPLAQDRYASVDALAGDLERFSTLRPVRARPATARYVASRFFQRNRLWVGLASLALLGLVSATIIATTLYIRAEKARAAADERFGEVRSLAKFMMFDLYDHSSGIPGTVRIRTEIAERSQKYLLDLSAAADAPHDVRLEAAQGFIRIAEIQGNSRSPNLADMKHASENLARAAELLFLLKATSGNSPVLAQNLGMLHELQCRMQLYGDHDAVQALAFAIKGEQELISANGGKRFDQILWQVRICRGDALTWLNRTQEAIGILSTELKRAESLIKRAPQTIDPIVFARTHRLLGEAYFYDNDPKRALKALTAAFGLISSVKRKNENDLKYLGEYISIADDLAATHSKLKQYQEVLRIATMAYDAAMQAYARDPADLYSLRRALSISRTIAVAHGELGDSAIAIRIMNSTMASWRKMIAEHPGDAALYRLYALSMRPFGDVLRKAGDLRGACQWYRNASTTWKKFDLRWGASASDKTEDIAYTAQSAEACAGHGAFSDE